MKKEREWKKKRGRVIQDQKGEGRREKRGGKKPIRPLAVTFSALS